MILDINGRITTSAHLICFASQDKTKYITVYPKLSWTDNISIVRCYDNVKEALEFLNTPVLQTFVQNEIILLLWTDTLMSVDE